MALKIEISKVSVLETMPKMWNIVVNLKIFNEDVEVHSKNFSIKYRFGEDIDAKQQEILGLMQSAINGYKNEQQVFNHAKMDNLVTFLNNNLEM